MMGRPIKTVLIANRGEIALRVIRTCRELGIRSVAVYSDVDRRAPHVLGADDAFAIGPAPSSQSYLNVDRLLETARKAGVDAIHPGYGFLSENAAFAQAVADAGFIFVGPSPDAIRSMGDKTRARMLVKRAGVATVPGTDGPVNSIGEAAAFCDKHGFPVLLKAAAGGGGKGMRLVHRGEDLEAAMKGAALEAGSAFADARIFIEKYLDRPHHVEFQVLGDNGGRVIHLGERECSVQRRHQKVVEESPSSILTPELRARMGETAVQAARSCGYTNAGTVEFLVDEKRNFYFLEMNTRLQVEHPITEMRTGLDLVALQLHIAAGNDLPLGQQDVRWTGHAIECRLCAEDVENNYMPSTGTITHLRPSQGIGIREDRGVNEGGEIPVHYDPMISKLIAWAPSRAEAIERMRRALLEYQILGVTTNIPLLLFVMEHEVFRIGDYTTHFLNDYFTPDLLSKGSLNARKGMAILGALLKDAEAGRLDGTDTNHQMQRRWRLQRAGMMRGT
jgi:acetyl-CoA carboxylase, biotin carboxylase subunit